MKDELSRRALLGRAGLALGGLVTIGSIGCSGDEDPKTIVEECPGPVDPGPQVAQFPYEQHIPATFRIDAEAIKAIREAAYQAYYAGGCCHGAYSALLGDLRRAGQPFTLLPLDFGKFGGGGIASYGSICGAVLGGVLISNMVIANADVRGKVMTELMRWYETFAFPHYVPLAVHKNEHTGGVATNPLATTLPFGTDPVVGNPDTMRVPPGSHLCHASVSGWCSAQNVSAAGPDKLARCARLTADVAGKTAELLDGYLASDRTTFTSSAVDGSTGCIGCHGKTQAVNPSVNSGMSCTVCHSDKTTGHPPAP